MARGRTTGPDGVEDGDRTFKLDTARLRLHVDVVTLEVVRALADHGVRAIVLKGPAVASWLYDDGQPRPYVDADLLVDPRQITQAGEVIASLGFDQLVDERVADAFAEPHAIAWSRPGDNAKVDLHWRLPGVAAEPHRAWTRLAGETEKIRIGESTVEALGRPARALHLVLHALQNGRESERPLTDLARGLERIEWSTWREAARLAAELDATVPFAVGLRLAPAGDPLSRRLGLPRTAPTRWLLWAQTPAPGAVRLHQLSATPGYRAKARVVAAALVPRAAYVRALYPSSRESSRALVVAYVRRWLAGLRSAPGAIRALRRAQAQAREYDGKRMPVQR